MFFQQLLAKLDYDIPGMVKLPKCPDPFPHRLPVDIEVARKMKQLVGQLPHVKIPSRMNLSASLQKLEKQHPENRTLLAELMVLGYSPLVKELTDLVAEEGSLPRRPTSFMSNKILLEELVKRLKLAADAEEQSKLPEAVEIRKELGSEVVSSFGDVWLGRKLYQSCFRYLKLIDENTDKMRVELWCLLSYVCIFFEDDDESQELGYDLPTKCLQMARELSRGQQWRIHKSIINISVPKVINVYGLRNDWMKMKTDWTNMYTVATSLLYVLSLKKAEYWKEELRRHELEGGAQNDRQLICEDVAENLTSALAYADEVHQYPAFMATVLRRGIFFDNEGDSEKCLEDYDALQVLSASFDDKEALAMVYNRLGRRFYESCEQQEALEYFSKEWELCLSNKFLELEGDALQSLGRVLLEEGHSWEADECYSQAFSLFRETRREDTPNEFEDICWAMSGVSKGQHLWGRHATILRRKTKQGLNSYWRWKSHRHQFPTAIFPKFKLQERKELDRQYAPQAKANRRLFEFEQELERRSSSWLGKKGYSNIFGFINASSKPRQVPGHEQHYWDWEEDDDVDEVESHTRVSASQVTSIRASVAQVRAESMADSFKKAIRKRTTQSNIMISNWVDSNYQLRVWKRRSKKLLKMNILQNPDMPLDEKLEALLEDMEYLTRAKKMEDDPSLFEADPEEERVQEAGGGVETKEEVEMRRTKAKSIMPADLLEEFQKFAANKSLHDF